MLALLLRAVPGHDSPAKRLTDLGFGDCNSCPQTVHVDTGLEAGLLQHEHQVFGGEVARGARCEGAAAKAADQAIEGADAAFEGGSGEGQSKTTGIVEMSGQTLCAVAPDQGSKEMGDLCRIAGADGVSDDHIMRASIEHPGCGLEYNVG